MFLGMFKERNEYGLSLIVCSFASFFMLPGLSSVSDVKNAHEKGGKKSMMAQKIAYRVGAVVPQLQAIVLQPQAVVPQPQAAAPQVVSSQAAPASELQASALQAVGAVASQMVVSPPAPQVRASRPTFLAIPQPEASGAQVIVPHVTGDQASGAQVFVSQAAIIQPLEDQASGAQAALREVPPQAGGNQVGATHTAFIEPVIVHPDHESMNDSDVGASSYCCKVFR